MKDRLFQRGPGSESNFLKSMQGNRNIVYKSLEDRGISDIVGGQNQKWIQEKQSPRTAVEEQKHTCELFMVRAVGTCVFSQSNGKILIPGIRQLEVMRGSRAGQSFLCLTHRSPPIQTSVAKPGKTCLWLFYSPLSSETQNLGSHHMARFHSTLKSQRGRLTKVQEARSQGES